MFLADLSSILKTAPADFISSNFPQHSIGFADNNLPAIVETDSEKFRIVSPGLNGQHGTVSLESDRHPGHYLRHRNFLIHLDEFEESHLFFEDASFRLKEGVLLPVSLSNTHASYKSVAFGAQFPLWNSPFRCGHWVGLGRISKFRMGNRWAICRWHKMPLQGKLCISWRT